MEERAANKTTTSSYCLLPGIYGLNLSLLSVQSWWLTVTGPDRTAPLYKEGQSGAPASEYNADT
jgi:hypothetical protein